MRAHTHTHTHRYIKSERENNVKSNRNILVLLLASLCQQYCNLFLSFIMDMFPFIRGLSNLGNYLRLDYVEYWMEA